MVQNQTIEVTTLSQLLNNEEFNRKVTPFLKKDISKNEVFELSLLDELWQAENWGFDEETSRKRKKYLLS